MAKATYWYQWFRIIRTDVEVIERGSDWRGPGILFPNENKWFKTEYSASKAHPEGSGWVHFNGSDGVWAAELAERQQLKQDYYRRLDSG